MTDDGLVHVREHSVCDLENKKLTLISRNVRLIRLGWGRVRTGTGKGKGLYLTSFCAGVPIQPVYHDREARVYS